MMIPIKQCNKFCLLNDKALKDLKAIDNASRHAKSLINNILATPTEVDFKDREHFKGYSKRAVYLKNEGIRTYKPVKDCKRRLRDPSELIQH